MKHWLERLLGLSLPLRVAMSLCLGILATLALPPFYIVPAFALAFSGLFLLLDRAETTKAAALLSWAFSFGHCVSGLYWVGIAFVVNEAAADAAGVVAVFGLSVILALYGALFGFGFAKLKRFLGPKMVLRLIAFALLWSAIEWLRGHALTGFPWNLAGSIWAFSPAMMQSLSVWGSYGLGLITLLLAVAPAALMERNFRPLMAAVLVVLGLYGFGVYRLADDQGAVHADVRLRIVQANVKQGEKWREDLQAQNFLSYVDLSLNPAEKPVTHIIWPETASPYFVNAEPAARDVIGRMTPQGGYSLIGAPGYYPQSENGDRITNSLFAIDDQGIVRAGYDKAHLVPFGEYLPLRAFLTKLGFERFVPGLLGSDFSAGEGLKTVRLPGLPSFGPLICYEVIFPAKVVDQGDRPEWVLNVTNDGWYGVSTGPYQHLVTAQMRAVEEGLPVVRAAGTGISAVINAYGVIQASLPLEARGVLDFDLPLKVENPTLFARMGDWSYFILFAILALLVTGYRGVANGDK